MELLKGSANRPMLFPSTWQLLDINRIWTDTLHSRSYCSTRTQIDYRREWQVSVNDDYRRRGNNGGKIIPMYASLCFSISALPALMLNASEDYRASGLNLQRVRMVQWTWWCGKSEFLEKKTYVLSLF